jgi:hypothetical protein
LPIMLLKTTEKSYTVKFLKSSIFQQSIFGFRFLKTVFLEAKPREIFAAGKWELTKWFSYK